MAGLRLVRKWGIPLATATAAPLLIPVVLADSGKREPVRPSQLPIYEEPQDLFDFEYYTKKRTSFEEGLGIVRTQVLEVVEATRSSRERIVHIYQTGVAHTMGTFDQIRDEDNVLAQASFIFVGGVAGLIGARKKGMIKKLLYTTTGVLAASSLCYPSRTYGYAERFSRCAKKHTVKYGTIVYNFVAGVQPQSSLTPETSKEEMPSDIAEIVEVSNLLAEDKHEEVIVEVISLDEETKDTTQATTQEDTELIVITDQLSEEFTEPISEELLNQTEVVSIIDTDETDLVSVPQSESLIEALAHELAASTPEKDSLESEVPEGNIPLAGEASTNEESSTSTGLLATAVNSAVAAVEGDHGQSSPDDVDMYTTRE